MKIKYCPIFPHSHNVKDGQTLDFARGHLLKKGANGANGAKVSSRLNTELADLNTIFSGMYR